MPMEWGFRIWKKKYNVSEVTHFSINFKVRVIRHRSDVWFRTKGAFWIWNHHFHVPHIFIFPKTLKKMVDLSYPYDYFPLTTHLYLYLCICYKTNFTSFQCNLNMQAIHFIPPLNATWSPFTRFQYWHLSSICQPTKCQMPPLAFSLFIQAI